MGNLLVWCQQRKRLGPIPARAGEPSGQCAPTQLPWAYPRLKRRGDGPPLSTSAWISTSIGRVPSSVTMTQLPGTGMGERAGRLDTDDRKQGIGIRSVLR